jgi:hypothetical protein
MSGLRVELFNEFPNGNASATDNENWMGKDSPYGVPHMMYYTNDFVNPDDADPSNLGAEEASMEMYGEMNMTDTTQKVFNYTGTTNDMFSLYIDGQLIIASTATANTEGTYTPATTGWKKVLVKWSNRGSTGDMNLTWKNNASTCAASCVNIPNNLLRVYAPQTAWYKAGTRIFTDFAGTSAITTDNVHALRWDSVSAIQNGATRTDGGNAFRNNAANLINGNPVFDNQSDKFLVGNSMPGGFESRMTTTWGLPLWNSARTMYTAGTASSPNFSTICCSIWEMTAPHQHAYTGVLKTTVEK